jgi:hypothetical protein
VLEAFVDPPVGCGFCIFCENKIKKLILYAESDSQDAAGLVKNASAETVDGLIPAAQRKSPLLFAGTTGAVVGLQQQ